MSTITLPALRDRLFAIRGAMMVTITALTEPKVIGGKSCPLHGMTKRSRVNGTINWHYGRAVNRQREKEQTPLDDEGNVEEFVPNRRTWGERLHEMIAERRNTRLLPLVALKWPSSTITLAELQTIPVDELYLEYRPGDTLEYRYYHEGREVPKEEAHQHIRQSSGSGRQGVEKTVYLRDYKLTNLEQIAMEGEILTIVK